MRINFSSVLESVFAQYESTDELKSAANGLIKQVQAAYETRYTEIAAGASNVKAKTATPAPTKTETKSKKDKAPKAKPVEAPKAETKIAGETDTLIAITDTAAIKKLGLTFEKYNDRCWVLRGNTKPLRKVLKEQFKGVFNSYLSGGEGWVIKTANVDECAKALGLKLPKAA
ncbi:hypothetical protein [Lepagella muris]|uniref:Uncharacterized protein n=1 Tax=Lepagella muris TaxID=3032870 RepID=A0AC61REK2_9BACT|nr:hypothetical protein [Lepagella muris]TGY79048.1 hypothetical protein E5331_08265 [Lepagella muris]THG52489.1 hypothetical protein E5984_07540 [Bacteroidales bacterium]